MVAGCHITTRSGAYLAVLVLVDGGRIVDVVDLAAPGGDAEPDALEQLRVRVRDVFRDHGVDRMALWRYEGSPGGVSINSARPIVRAEGIVLAGAGEAGVNVVEI